MNTPTIERPAIGTPAHQGGVTGYVGRLIAAAPGVSMLTAGGMKPVVYDLEIIFPDHVSKISDCMAADWIERAARMGLEPISPADLEALKVQAQGADAARRDAARDKREREEAERAAFLIVAAERLPNWAKAVIYAELCEDVSDSMSDYFNSRTVRTIILGFSTHTRDLFPEMRKAALNHPDTAHLFEAPESAEHREKYSMGRGFYLKTGGRHRDGWRIAKQSIRNGARDIPTGEWSLTPPTPAKAAPSCTPPGALIVEHTHERKGFQMWIVTMSERVERDEFERLRDLAKTGGGWWSRQWGNSPAGFAFKVQASAEAFAAGLAPLATESTTGTPSPVRSPSPNLGAKFRAMADAMQGEIDGKFRDRQTNTPKRQREAQSARLDGMRLQRVQMAARALAALCDAGTVPPDLRGVTTKAALFDLAGAEISRSGGYYDAGHETGKPSKDTPAARDFWALLDAPDPAKVAADDLRRKVEALQFANIPGYFPTPAPVIDLMIERARLPDQQFRLLEPEAGSGAILDRVRAEGGNVVLFSYERHNTLRQILIAKEYAGGLEGEDFMESDLSLKVDRVLMNPPFENGQDMAHVRRAFLHLSPGGRLVAIMSPGPFYRQDRASREFREWFEELGGEREDIPAGTFKASGTMVATVLVVIDA